MDEETRRAWRMEVLAAFGARPELTEALLAYGEATPRTGPLPSELPLPDEPVAEAWRGYAAEARQRGAVSTLRRHLIQFRFPIEAGISGRDEYRRGTRRGDWDAASEFAPGLQLRDGDGISLDVHEGMGGALPVIVARDRSDFVAIVQALSGRNEPVDVPDSMGACLVRGLNNWSRVAAHRRQWEADGDRADAWSDEFERLIPQRERYQDQLVILSAGPYSAVAAAAVGATASAWLEQSLVIRREHEFVHHFTSRCLGTLRDHPVDELVADFVGVVLARGRYEAALGRRFLGLEDYPRWRPDGRLENYRPASLPDEAMDVVRGLVHAAAGNLEAIGDALGPDPADRPALARLTLAVVTMSLEELASDAAVSCAKERLG